MNLSEFCNESLLCIAKSTVSKAQNARMEQRGFNFLHHPLQKSGFYDNESSIIKVESRPIKMRGHQTKFSIAA